MNQLPINPVDLAILGIMLLSAIFSWVRGFTGEVLAVASWAAASVAAYYLHPMALTYLTPMIPNPKLAGGGDCLGVSADPDFRLADHHQIVGSDP